MKRLCLIAGMLAITCSHAQDAAPQHENAIKEVSIVPASSGCTGSLKPVAITNRSSSRAVMAKVEVTMAYSMHASHKVVTVDNLVPQEVRALGCTGCNENGPNKVCTTYRVLLAWYK